MVSSVLVDNHTQAMSLVAWDIPDEQVHTINFIALATGPEAANGGLWELPEPSGERFSKENHSPK